MGRERAVSVNQQMTLWVFLTDLERLFDGLAWARK